MSEFAAQITLFANGAISAWMAYYAFTCIFTPAIKKRWILLAYSAYLIIATQMFFEFESPWLYLTINLVSFFALTFLFRGNLSTKLVFALLIYIVGMLAEWLSFLIINFTHYIQYGTNISLEDILPIARTITSMVFLPLVLLVILIFRKFVNKKARHKHFKVPAKYTLSILLMLLGIIFVNTLFLFTAIAMAEIQESITPITISHLVSSGIILLITWVYNTILNHLEEVEKNQQRDQMLERWEIQYRTAVSSQKIIAELEHNLSYHFLTLASLLREGKTANAEQYIADKIGRFDTIISTGNMPLDTMLNFYRQKIKERLDIDLGIELSILPDMKMDAELLATILGNALENALEACAYVEPAKRYIHIKAVLTSQSELILTVTNSYAVAPVVDSAGNFITTKADKEKHGIGLSSIQEILSKEVGHIQVDYDDNMFQFSLFFYNVG